MAGVLACIDSFGLAGADCIDYEDYLHWVGGVETPGYTYGVAVSGHHAYVADGAAGLQVIDITNPASPQIVGGKDTPGNARDVAVSGTHAWVADGASGLQVIDITNPQSPQIVGSVDTPGYAYCAVVSGTHAYVADGPSGLQAIDITNPGSPQIVGSVDTPESALDVAVSGSYAYVADSTSGLQVIDVANPQAPQVVASVSAPGWRWAQGVAVSGIHAYVATWQGGLLVIDISNPHSPQSVGHVVTPAQCMRVAVSGTHAYVADYWGELQVIDIASPQNPGIVGSVTAAGITYSVAISGTHAYVAGGSSGLQVIDASNPASPQIVGSVVPPGEAGGMAVASTYTYLAADGLQVIDVSNPASPQIVGSVVTPGSAYDVAIAGTNAYVADGSWGGLQVIDVTNPTNPQIVGSVSTPGGAFDVSVASSCAYVADYGSGLQVIDITNPQSPQIVGSVDTPGYARGVAVSGTHAYVGDSESGLQVVDITNPASPVIVGSVDTPGYAGGVAVSGTYAYVADWASGLEVIDITNPLSPWIVGSVEIAGMTWDVAVAGTHAYVAAEGVGLLVLDVTSPQSPRISGSVTIYSAHRVAVAGACAYVAGYNDGLQILPAQCDPAAACCLETGACSVVTETECNQLGGTWYADRPSCEPNDCPNPTVVQVEAGNWVDPEPWHDWVANEVEAGIPVQAHIPEHYGDIEHVEFYVSLDQGSTWDLIADDEDGYEPSLGPDSSVVMTGCGWSTSYVVPESTQAGPIQFKSIAYPDSGAPVEDIREHVYDPLPPSLGTVNLEDFQVIDEEALGIEVDSHGMEVTRIIVHLAPMEEVFTKGIPGISQQTHSAYHCAPTAAAQCLKYFEGVGDTLVSGGLGDDGLVDGLAAYMSTSSSAGTLPSNWVGGIGQWLGTYGDGYTVRYYSHYSCEGSGSTWTEDDWRRVRNELELCRDVLLGIFWDGGGAHALTLNSIAYPALPSGNIVVGFMDPWTGVESTWELDPLTGHITDPRGGGSRSSGQIGLTMLVSPKEEGVYAGGPGNPVYDGMPSGDPPYQLEIQIPTTGLWFVYVTLVNGEEHANRLTNIVEREVSGVEEEGEAQVYALEAGKPNPFQARTTIAYSVPEQTEVSLRIYDVTGRTVKTLVAGEVAAGWHKVEWDGTDGLRRPGGSGIYYVRMEAGGYQRTARITLLR